MSAHVTRALTHFFFHTPAINNNTVCGVYEREREKKMRGRYTLCASKKASCQFACALAAIRKADGHIKTHSMLRLLLCARQRDFWRSSKSRRLSVCMSFFLQPKPNISVTAINQLHASVLHLDDFSRFVNFLFPTSSFWRGGKSYIRLYSPPLVD